jgi:hypothetical protein
LGEKKLAGLAIQVAIKATHSSSQHCIFTKAPALHYSYAGLISFLLLIYKIAAFCILCYEASQCSMHGDGRSKEFI